LGRTGSFTGVCFCGFCTSTWLLNPPVDPRRQQFDSEQKSRGASTDRRRASGRRLVATPWRGHSQREYFLLVDDASAISDLTHSTITSYFQAYQSDRGRLGDQHCGATKIGSSVQAGLALVFAGNHALLFRPQ